MNVIIYYISVLGPRGGSLSFQPAEEKAQGDLTYVYLMGGIKKTDPDSSQGCPVPGEEAVSTN